MNIVKTEFKHGRVYVMPETYNSLSQLPTNICGLKTRYTTGNMDDIDHVPWNHPYGAGYSRNGPTEFSEDDQDILSKYLQKALNQKEKIIIVEIGVCRNPYYKTSTSILIDNKRDHDIYIGIDIDDKSYLNNPSKNVFTLKTRSEDVSTINAFLHQLSITNIDLLMIDGYHSINQVYKEWEIYIPMLSEKAIVVFHDTNSHLGPICVLNSIDTNQYDVYKYLTDLRDWGIGVAIKK